MMCRGGFSSEDISDGEDQDDNDSVINFDALEHSAVLKKQ